MHQTGLAVVLSVCLGMASVAHGAAIVSGKADTFANATSARVASTSGTINDDPDAAVGTTGVIHSTAEAEAGPIDPEQDRLNFPGTTGVSNGSADAMLNITDGGSRIEADLLAETDFRTMDGGNYTAESQAEFEVVFSVAVDTPYQITGSFNVDDEDMNWKLQLEGSGGAPGFLINHFTENDALTGPLSVSGTLLAGRTYTYTGRVDVDEVRNFDNGSFDEFSQLNATLVIPEPTSLALLTLAGAAMLRPRRRQPRSR